METNLNCDLLGGGGEGVLVMMVGAGGTSLFCESQRFLLPLV